MIHRLLYAAALLCSLHSEHHAPHGAELHIGILLGHGNARRAIMRAL